jgi:predicted alpha/beta superfamily hydrolase
MKNISSKYRLNAISMCLSLAFLCYYSSVRAQTVEIPNTEIKHITSETNNIQYKLFISLPEGYNLKGHHSYREKYPVLYLLDPDAEFTLAESIAHTLVNFDVIEPFIIVGIGYKNQDLSTMSSKAFWDQVTLNRARDYIPIPIEKEINRFESGDANYKGLASHTGGSEKFKNFIEKELISYIDSSYRATKERVLLGHSQGGLFATWMLLNYPSIFGKYIILSPSLWVEKGWIIKQAHQLKTNTKIKAYFAAGSLEYDANGSMVDNLKLFYSDLPKSKNFAFKLEIIDGENHASMLPAGLTKGFKFIFGKE